ncbi:Uncharacterized protein APZ42_002450 [Daphnia magna]|uniref:Uncharacterized protein n=1 Tax=Daphnia magna TaxID=35525 RepID=A0A164I953_9CRUS|nr:Uncharacterized protein APZ42_002450 [Daphnia magna]
MANAPATALPPWPSSTSTATAVWTPSTPASRTSRSGSTATAMAAPTPASCAPCRNWAFATSTCKPSKATAWIRAICSAWSRTTAPRMGRTMPWSMSGLPATVAATAPARPPACRPWVSC